MRIAGLRDSTGKMWWVDAREYHLSPCDKVIFRAAGQEVAGQVFVSPEALLVPSPRVDGVVVAVVPEEAPGSDCSDLPGAEIPALGSQVCAGTMDGRVVGVDAVRDQVRLKLPDEREVVLRASELTAP